MANLQLTAEPREIVGRKVKKLRAKGLLPVVVYGATDHPVNLQVNVREFERTLHDGGATQLVEVSVSDGSRHNILVREIQRSPVGHHLMHADFYAVNMSEKQYVSVPIHRVGEPEAIDVGLMLLQALDQVELEALPANIPAQIEVDVTGVSLDNAILVSDLPVIEGVEYLTDPDETVFTMITTRVEEEEEEEEALDGELAEPELVGADDEDEEEE